MGRLAEAVRSFWLGPFGSGERELARLMSGSSPALSGVAITEDSALTIAAFWSGVRIISESVASLPLHLYKRIGESGKERFTSHLLHKILHDAPNTTVLRIIIRSPANVHTSGTAVVEAGHERGARTLWQSRWGHVVQAVPGAPRGLKPLGRRAGRRKTRGSGGETLARSAAR
jgi:hypothetical protein